MKERYEWLWKQLEAAASTGDNLVAVVETGIRLAIAETQWGGSEKQAAKPESKRDRPAQSR